MKKFVVYCAVVLMASAVVQPAFAIKEFGEFWGKNYVEGSKNEEFKKLAGDAKCNVCHIDGENKKKHNPYGEALKEAGLTKKEFPKEKLKDAAKEINAIFTKAEELKAKGSDKSFGQRIKDGLLPGGDAKGK